jgi:hypothetical protein
MARLLLVVAIAACGCTGGELGPGLGEPCSVFCSPGLVCSAAHFCEKSCHCDWDGGPAWCPATASISSGCPSTSACVATAATGEGMCAVLCADAGCPAGEGACAAAPDGTRLCVGPDFPWQGRDAGILDQAANSD